MKGGKMSRKSIKVVVFVLLGILLATLPGLVGCAGEEKATGKEIKYGWLWDFTGRAAVGVTQVFQGFKDYLRMTEEEDPIPGVTIKLVTYDTKSESARVMPGYVWLKGKGVDIMSAAPQDTEVLRSRFEAEQMPFYSLSNILSMLDSEWLVSLFGPPEGVIEVLLQWIMDNWEDYPTKPKIGFVGLSGVPFYESQLETAEEWMSDYPDKFEYVGAQMSPSTTTTWAIEIGRLKESDFIIAAMSGPPLASFLIEARNRGYEGKLVGPMESFLAFWSLMKGAVPEEALDGVVVGVYQPWWNDTGAFMTQVKEYTEEYYSPDDVETLYLGTGQYNGWAAGMIFVDALRRAVDEVGAENVDGIALYQALKETNMTVEGFGSPWRITEEANCFMQTVRLMEYSSEVGDWVVITDWSLPPCLGG
jgi:hypothetical protein